MTIDDEYEAGQAQEDQEHDDSLLDPIQTALEECGWRPVSGEGSRWVDHVFDNGNGQLGLSYLPPHEELVFDFESDTHTVRLNVAFETRPDQVLEVFFRHQADLSEESWPVFIEELLVASPRVSALEGEDSEEETPVTSMESGTAALRERSELEGLMPD